VELAPLLVSIFKDGIDRYGEGELSPNIIRRLEEACETSVRRRGFPAQITDESEERLGAEVKIAHRKSESAYGAGR